MADFNLDDAIKDAVGPSRSASGKLDEAITQGDTGFDIDAAISEAGGTAPAPTPADTISPVTSAALGVGKGATAGFLPQLGGLIAGAGTNIANIGRDALDGNWKDALLGRPDGVNILRGGNGNPNSSAAYRDPRDAIKQFSDESAKQNPKSDIGGQVVGTLVPGSLLGKAAAATRLGTVAAPMVANGIQGGANAASQTDWSNLPQALRDTAAATGIGATVGAVPGVGQKGKEITKEALESLAAKFAPKVASTLENSVVKKGLGLAEAADKKGIYPNDVNRFAKLAQDITTDPIGTGQQAVGQSLGGMARHGVNHALGIGTGGLSYIKGAGDKLVGKKVGQFVEDATPKALDFAADHATRSATFSPFSSYLGKEVPTNEEQASEKRRQAMDNSAVSKPR